MDNNMNVELHKQKTKKNLKQIFSNISWLFIERIVRMFLTLVVGALLARYLGPEQFGVWNYALAIIAILDPISKLGLNSIVVRNLNRESENRDTILGTAFIMKICSGSISVFTIILLIQFSNFENIGLTVLILSFMLIFQAFDAIDLYFQSIVLSKYIVIAKVISFSISSILKLIFIFLELPLSFIALSNTLDLAIVSVIYIYLYKRRKLSIRTWKYDHRTMLDLLKDSWPLILSGFAAIIYMKFDQIMLGNLSTEKELGYFSAAVKMSEVWYFIPTIVVASVAPSITQAHIQKKNKEYINKIQNTMNFLFAGALIIACVITILSPLIIQVVYGDQYSNASSILTIHIWASLFVFLGVARNPYLVNENLTKFSFLTTIIGAIVNVLLNFILIPRYGAVGASISTLISQFFASFLSNILYYKTRIVFMMQLKAILYPIKQIKIQVRRYLFK